MPHIEHRPSNLDLLGHLLASRALHARESCSHSSPKRLSMTPGLIMYRGIWSKPEWVMARQYSPSTSRQRTIYGRRLGRSTMQSKRKRAEERSATRDRG